MKFKVGDIVINNEELTGWGIVHRAKVVRIIDEDIFALDFFEMSGIYNDITYPNNVFKLDQAFKNEQKLKRVLGLLNEEET